MPPITARSQIETAKRGEEVPGIGCHRLKDLHSVSARNEREVDVLEGSCGISKPFGDHNKLAEYLASGDEAKLRRRLEADVKSLYALYEYCRLHGAVRLRWGFLDERIHAPWVHRDERMLYDLKQSALAMNVPLEVVVGSAPGWEEPWSRVRLARVAQDANGWRTWLVGEGGYLIDEHEVQRARLPMSIH